MGLSVDGYGGCSCLRALVNRATGNTCAGSHILSSTRESPAYPSLAVMSPGTLHFPSHRGSEGLCVQGSGPPARAPTAPLCRAPPPRECLLLSRRLHPWPPSLLPGNRELAKLAAVLSLPLGRADLGNGRSAGMTHRPRQECAPLSQGWVLTAAVSSSRVLPTETAAREPPGDCARQGPAQ